MRISLLVSLLSIGLLSTGCRTLASYESIPVESQPSGADVVVECGALRMTAVTPGRILLARSAPDCRVTLRKEGYADEVMWLRRGVNDTALAATLSLVGLGRASVASSPTGGGIDADAAGEVVIFGVVPFVVNLATCNYCTHEPKQLSATLRPLPAPSLSR